MIELPKALLKTFQNTFNVKWSEYQWIIYTEISVVWMLFSSVSTLRSMFVFHYILKRNMLLIMGIVKSSNIFSRFQSSIDFVQLNYQSRISKSLVYISCFKSRIRIINCWVCFAISQEDSKAFANMWETLARQGASGICLSNFIWQVSVMIFDN